MRPPDLSPSPSERRLALALAVPALAVVAALTAIEAWRLMSPRAADGVRVHVSMADAIAAGDLLGAYEFVRLGQDPGAPILVRDPVLTGGRDLVVSPVVWAAAHGQGSIVLMLLGAGATLDDERLGSTRCLAARAGFAGVVEALRRASRVTPGPCPAASDEPPLHALAERW
jgi:hypothetical protein